MTETCLRDWDLVQVIRVTNQEQFDMALIKAIDKADNLVDIDIMSSPKEPMVLNAPKHIVINVLGDSEVTLLGETSVNFKQGSPKIKARDTSTVRGYGDATVWAYDRSEVTARYGTMVMAFNHAKVDVINDCEVYARHNSFVEAGGGCVVHACDTSHVVAWNMSNVDVTGECLVEAHEGSRVNASRSVVVHALKEANVTATPSVSLYRMEYGTAATGETPKEWVERHNVQLTDDGLAVLYVAVPAADKLECLYNRFALKSVVTNDDTEQPLFLFTSKAEAWEWLRTPQPPLFYTLEVELDDIVPCRVMCLAAKAKVVK